MAYGLNLPALSGTAPQPVFPAVIKLLAKNLAFWSGKKTIFYGISRNSKTFLSDLKTLFDLLKTGRLSVPIKAVFQLENIQGGPSRVGEGLRDGFNHHQGSEVIIFLR